MNYKASWSIGHAVFFIFCVLVKRKMTHKIKKEQEEII